MRRYSDFQRNPCFGSKASWDITQSIAAEAREIGDRALAMEVQLLHCRNLVLPLYPLKALENLRIVRTEARANQLGAMALSAQTGIAMALSLAGEERHAISVATSALADPLELKADDAATAVLASAIAHVRVGELHHALDVLVGRGADLLKANAPTHPLLPARFAWAQALVHWNAYILHRFPALWRGPCPETDIVHGISAPDKAQLIGLFDAADELLPPGVIWPYGRLTKMCLSGLEASNLEVNSSVENLRSAALKLEGEEPLASSLARLYCSALNFNSGNHVQALSELHEGYTIASRFGYVSVRRDFLVYEARILEATSDYVGALKAHKELATLRIRSLHVDERVAQDGGDPRYREAERGAARVVKNLAPRHVLRALKFIDEHVHERIAVEAIVKHCQVSRRSLETAFRQVCACTLTEYIKQTKLRAAAEELLRSLRPIRDVAKEMGFSSPAAFSRDFSAQYGMPPSVWVRAHRLTDEP